MKKIVLLMFALVAMCANAQEINLDKKDENGRLIMCKQESMRSFSDKVLFDCALSRSQIYDEVYWQISLVVKQLYSISIPKGSRLLIKLKDDSIIELKSINDVEDRIGDAQVIGSSVISQYTVFPTYSVTEEQIAQISQGVKKIRVETSLQPIDKEFKKDKMGKIIEGQYKVISERAKTSNNFNEGF